MEIVQSAGGFPYIILAVHKDILHLQDECVGRLVGVGQGVGQKCLIGRVSVHLQDTGGGSTNREQQSRPPVEQYFGKVFESLPGSL